jgi:hypothetical protein
MHKILTTFKFLLTAHLLRAPKRFEGTLLTTLIYPWNILSYTHIQLSNHFPYKKAHRMTCTHKHEHTNTCTHPRHAPTNVYRHTNTSSTALQQTPTSPITLIKGMRDHLTAVASILQQHRLKQGLLSLFTHQSCCKSYSWLYAAPMMYTTINGEAAQTHSARLGMVLLILLSAPFAFPSLNSAAIHPIQRVVEGERDTGSR